MTKRLRKLLLTLMALLALCMTAAPVYASEQPGIKPPVSINLNNCVVTFESRGMYYFVNRIQGGSVVQSFNSTDYTIAHNKYDLWIRTYGCIGVES
jgi:hypothetical protein